MRIWHAESVGLFQRESKVSRTLLNMQTDELDLVVGEMRALPALAISSR